MTSVDHSATALVAAGNPPPSPNPSMNRLPASIAKPRARPRLAQASDHQSMTTRNPRRVPRASISLPPPTYMKAYAIGNAACNSRDRGLTGGLRTAVDVDSNEAGCGIQVHIAEPLEY